MTIFPTIALRIIQEQELIIGPLAWGEAKKVIGLKVDDLKKEVEFVGSEPEGIDNLVKQYERLFGRASREVCKEAAKEFIYEIPQDQVPALLR